MVDVAGRTATVELRLVVGDALLTLRDEVAAPGGQDLDLRGNGLWLSVVEEDPGRWSVALEAFALRVDHDGDELGVPTPLLLDLEWEAGRLVGEVRRDDHVEHVDAPATLRRAG